MLKLLRETKREREREREREIERERENESIKGSHGSSVILVVTSSVLGSNQEMKFHLCGMIANIFAVFAIFVFLFCQKKNYPCRHSYLDQRNSSNLRPNVGNIDVDVIRSRFSPFYLESRKLSCIIS